jgi:hypothetical protein
MWYSNTLFSHSVINGIIFRKWDVGVWAGLGWLRIEKWQAIVNEVMKLRVP